MVNKIFVCSPLRGDYEINLNNARNYCLFVVREGYLPIAPHLYNSEKRKHPTQKPVELGRWILNKFAKEGDLIFDPFTGSGSFIVACKHLGFKYIGCEIDKEYCDIANKRLEQSNLNSFL